MNPRIAVVGTGAIGGYYGGKLAAAGHDVHFLVRGDLSELRGEGLHLTGPGEDLYVRPIHCFNHTAEIGPCDLVLVALKTTSNAELSKLLPPLVGQDTMLLTLQNGLGNEELLADQFGEEYVLGALCFICLTRTSRTTIVRADVGHLTLGEFKRRPAPRTRALAEMFNRAGITCNLVDDLILERWRKLVWNIPFNSLSILGGDIDTAEILRDNELRRATVELMDEVITAANKCGYNLERDAAAEQIRRTGTMGAYRPSTLLDFEAGRPLEVEAIWGEPFRRAEACGASVPRLAVLYALLRSLDRSRQLQARRLPPQLSGPDTPSSLVAAVSAAMISAIFAHLV